jgi:hypothetical protein
MILASHMIFFCATEFTIGREVKKVKPEKKKKKKKKKKK